MESCEKLSALLDAFIDGELPEAEMDQVRRHLAECEDCRAYVADAFAMREAFADLADVQVPEDFTRSVMDAVRSAPPQARSKRRSLRPVRILVPLAACLAIAAVVGLGPLSSRMTQDAAQVVSQDTCEAADAAEPQERDVSSDTQDTGSDPLDTQDTPQTFGAASAPQESEQAQVEKEKEEATAQEPPSLQSTMQVPPENSAPYQVGNAPQEETASQAATPPQNNAPTSITTARVDGEDTSQQGDSASQEDAETYFTELTLTADQVGTLLDGVEAAQTVRDPDTGAELQRIYHLDRNQFESLMDQLEGISWKDTGSGDWAKVIVVMA